MTKSLRLLTLCLALLVAFGCSGEKKDADVAETTEAPAAEAPVADASGTSAEPDYVSVQHILVGFEGSVPGKAITRTQVDAAAFAAELLERARGGEDFDALVKEYTDDSYPGIYDMANHHAKENLEQQILPRKGIVPAFGNVGFKLAVDEIGLAQYDAQDSPFGYHIIKRVK